jgi:hypothetical protein
MHDTHDRCINTLKHKVDNRVKRDTFNHLEAEVETKLDKWIFVLFVTSIAIFITIASAAYGWIAIETINLKTNVVILQANQEKLMEHFDLSPVRSEKEAEKLIK